MKKLEEIGVELLGLLETGNTFLRIYLILVAFFWLSIGGIFKEKI